MIMERRSRKKLLRKVTKQETNKRLLRPNQRKKLNPSRKSASPSQRKSLNPRRKSPKSPSPRKSASL